jgi:hypothetical protein
MTGLLSSHPVTGPPGGQRVPPSIGRVRVTRAFLLSPLLLVVAAQVSQSFIKLALYVGGYLWVLEGGG